jgi:hypothetical protein
MLVSLTFPARFFPSDAHLVRLFPSRSQDTHLPDYSTMPSNLNPNRQISTFCILEYRSHLARQRNKIKTLIPDDELGDTLGESLLIRTRFDPQLAFLRHFHTASTRAIKSHHPSLFHLLTSLAATTKLPEQQKYDDLLSTDF